MSDERICGLMLDPARLTERHEFYFELLPRLKEWGFNTVWWHFSDDEGCALKLKGHPDLAAPFAFNATETRRWIQAARAEGLDVVPELECLGHTRYITGLARYAHLFDGNPWGHNALCPSHPETMPLLAALIRETAALFPSPYFHAGLDEAQIGDCPRCGARAKDRPDWHVFLEHVRAVHAVVRECGKRMIMWADSVERHPELLAELPKDIVLAHWHYQEVRAEALDRSLAAGFEVVGVPAMSGDVFLPNAMNIRNVADMGRATRERAGRGCLGLVTCWWESMRVLRDSVLPVLAWAGAQGGDAPADWPAFAAGWAETFFGLARAEDGRAVADAYACAAARAEMRAFFPDSLVDLHLALERAAAPGFEARMARTMACAIALDEALPRVQRHKKEFAALCIAVRLTATGLCNGVELTRAWEAYRTGLAGLDGKRPAADVLPFLEKARRIMGEMAEQTDIGAGLADMEWDRTRHVGDEKKDNRSERLRQRAERACLPIVMQSRAFLADVCGGLDQTIRSLRKGVPAKS